jgi:hypothetical protein
MARGCRENHQGGPAPGRGMRTTAALGPAAETATNTATAAAMQQAAVQVRQRVSGPDCARIWENASRPAVEHARAAEKAQAPRPQRPQRPPDGRTRSMGPCGGFP